MKISFDIDQQEVDLLINSLTLVAGQTNDQNSRDKLLLIIQEIKADVGFEDVVFHYVYQLLDPYTKQDILKSSNLRNGLVISTQWIDNFLAQGCNNILDYLLILYKPKKTTSPITNSEASSCETVQDIIDLIKTKYEGAL